MKRAFASCAALVALAGLPASAQGYDDPMEEQRCIWRCLASSSGAASPEYALCVERVCNEQLYDDADPNPDQTAIAKSAPRWFVGATSDGRGRFAGVSDPTWGNSFYVMCAPDGRRYFAMFGPEGPGARLTLTMNGQSFAMDFVAENDGYYASVSSDLRELVALRAASELTINNAAGTALLQADLNGAAEAIATACP
ncbi:MAG: hypothetical protein ACK4MS_05815 [Paracoccaceae bacterium]